MVDELQGNAADITASSFRCCLGGVNPLDVEATSQWLESDGIREEFKQQIEATGKFVGIQSRPAGPGKKKKRQSDDQCSSRNTGQNHIDPIDVVVKLRVSLFNEAGRYSIDTHRTTANRRRIFATAGC